MGYDIHALKKGRKLRLGGVTIPCATGLLGHSDADVLLHAILDGVLGAMGEGDLGDHFPSGDPKYRGADSVFFVREIVSLLKKKKQSVAHIDATLILEEPKLTPYKLKIRERIADEFGLPLSSVSVKAKTNDGLGLIGKNKAIACFSVVSLK